MSEALARLASAHGIALDYHDIWGQPARVVRRDASSRCWRRWASTPSDDASANRGAARASMHARDRARIAPLVVLRENARPWTLQLPAARGALAGARA